MVARIDTNGFVAAVRPELVFLVERFHSHLGDFNPCHHFFYWSMVFDDVYPYTNNQDSYLVPPGLRSGFGSPTLVPNALGNIFSSPLYPLGR